MDGGWAGGGGIIGDLYVKRLSTDTRYIKLHESFITDTFTFKYSSCCH